MAIVMRIVAALLTRNRLRTRNPHEGQRRTHSPEPWRYGQGYAFGETDLNFGRAAP